MLRRGVQVRMTQGPRRRVDPVIAGQERAVFLTEGVQRLVPSHAVRSQPSEKLGEDWVTTVVLLGFRRNRWPFTLDDKWPVAALLVLAEEFYHLGIHGQIANRVLALWMERMRQTNSRLVSDDSA